jgi:nicotinamide mononucleotide transporter
MSLQFYYFGISIYGWFIWKHGSGKQSGKLPVKRTTNKEWMFFITFIIVLTGISGFLLDHYTDSTIPYWDAFTSSGSIMATWMLARKYLEHWLIWIVVDIVSIGTYIYKGLYPTITLFMVYTGMAAMGYYQWKKELAIQNKN